MIQTKKVWLVTGSANGLGRNIGETALKAGHRVVATARNVDQLDDLVTLLGRAGQPDDMADVAVFLASEDSRFMTGELMRVTGGMA